MGKNKFSLFIMICYVYKNILKTHISKSKKKQQSRSICTRKTPHNMFSWFSKY